MGRCRANEVDAGCRWMVLDDQNLCIQTSSSFIYGALPIRGDIYVVGDLDTGEWNGRLPPPPLPPPPRASVWARLQERTSTTSGSSAAAPAGGTAPCPCCPPTSPSPPAPPCASPTVDSSTFSCARGPSGCESSRSVRTAPDRTGLSAGVCVCRGFRGTCAVAQDVGFSVSGNSAVAVCLGLFRETRNYV